MVFCDFYRLSGDFTAGKQASDGKNRQLLWRAKTNLLGELATQVFSSSSTSLTTPSTERQN